MRPHLAAQTQRWPPERFYWAALEFPGWKPPSRAAPLPPGLVAQVAEDLPVDSCELHIVVVPAAGGRIVACAATREALAAVPADVMRVVPDSLPGCLSAHDLPDLTAINLLVGQFEPAPVRRARRRRHLSAAAIALTLAALATTGMLRRAGHWDQVAGRARAAAGRIIEQSGLEGLSPDADPATTLLAESIRLQRLAEAANALRLPTDVTPALASFLAAWPASVPSNPQSFSLGGSGAAMAVTLEGEPTAFLSAFQPPPGWTMDEPRLNRVGALTRISLQFRPSPVSAIPHEPTGPRSSDVSGSAGPGADTASPPLTPRSPQAPGPGGTP